MHEYLLESSHFLVSDCQDRSQETAVETGQKCSSKAGRTQKLLDVFGLFGRPISRTNLDPRFLLSLPRALGDVSTKFQLQKLPTSGSTKYELFPSNILVG